MMHSQRWYDHLGCGPVRVLSAHSFCPRSSNLANYKNSYIH